jgi:cyclase
MEGVRKVGDPNVIANSLEEVGIDEISFMDTVSSLYGRNSLSHIVSCASEHLLTPLCVAGGINSLDGVTELLRFGADKIAINTAAVRRPQFITEIADKLGTASTVVHIDAKKTPDGWEAYCDGGRQPTGLDAVAWAKAAQELGAGELIVTSIDKQGLGRGLDLELIGSICNVVSIPVVASGGAGSPEDFHSAYLAGASGVASAKMLRESHQNVRIVKSHLKDKGVPVRA